MKFLQILKEVAETGECVYSTEHHQYVLTKRILNDAPNHSIMHNDVIPVMSPVKLLHGMKDEKVPFQVSLDLAEKIQTSFVSVNFRKSADHRFSQPEDIELIFDSLNAIIKGSDDTRNMAIRSFESFSRYSYVPESDMIQRAKANRRSMPFV